MKRKQLCAFTSLFLAGILCTGCFGKSRSDKDAMKFVEEKYNIDVEYHGSDEYTWCYTKEMEQEGLFIKVAWDPETKTYGDTYFHYMVREDEEAYVKDVCQEVFPEVKVYNTYYNEWLPDEYDGNATFEDVLNGYDKYTLEVAVYICYQDGWTTEDIESRIAEVEKELQSREHDYWLTFIVLNDDLYSSMTRSDIDAYWDLLLDPDGYGVDYEHIYYEDSRQYYRDFKE